MRKKRKRTVAQSVLASVQPEHFFEAAFSKTQVGMGTYSIPTSFRAAFMIVPKHFRHGNLLVDKATSRATLAVETGGMLTFRTRKGYDSIRVAKEDDTELAIDWVVKDW